MKNTIFITIAAILLSVGSVFAQSKFELPVYNNTYVNYNFGEGRHFRGNHEARSIQISESGISMTKDANMTASSYYYLKAGQKAKVGIIAEGKGTIEVDYGTKVAKVKVNSKMLKEYAVCTINQTEDGYVKFTYHITDANDNVQISKFTFAGVTECPVYLKETYSNHFGLRGPSCHLNYSANRYEGEMEWAKIDVTVPEEYDKIGSYYMALGFNCGYFGFQNNSPNRRQVLFSVWNSQDADNPNDVQPENQTQIIRTGEGVTAQNFGHEGSGKQSFRTVNWKPGKTYSFLLHAEKYDETHVDFSAWFYDSEADEWLFMSTLRRPKTTRLIGGLHSFLENFSPMMGDKTRKAYYHNGWFKTVGNDWQPIIYAGLTNDATAREGVRLDFNGGVEDGKFFLTNGGYFKRTFTINRRLAVDGSKNTKPDYDLQKFLDTLK